MSTAKKLIAGQPLKSLLDLREEVRRCLAETNAQCRAEYASVRPNFAERGGVLFHSYYRVWEKYHHTPQWLARTLGSDGIKVTWLDGTDWRSYRPFVDPPAENLTVSQFPKLPAERFFPIWWATAQLQRKLFDRYIAKLGGDPVVWIHGGTDKAFASVLPKIDVFSCFDDLTRYEADHKLYQTPRLVTFQNEYAQRKMNPSVASKCLYSPLAIGPEYIHENSDWIQLPKNFPSRRMGFVGSCLSNYIDYDLIEHAVKSLPNWGMILMGRIDEEASKRIEKLNAYANFLYLPWQPRSRVGAAWKLLDLAILPYKAKADQEGSFSSKSLEAMYFGVPVTGPLQPKTEALTKYFPLFKNQEDALATFDKALAVSLETRLAAFKEFAYLMNPFRHLFEVGQQLGVRRPR